MNNGLRSETASALFDDIKPYLRSSIEAINSLHFQDCRKELIQAKLRVRKQRNGTETRTEDHLNDTYVICRYIDFLGAYSRLWKKLVTEQFAESWTVLQDCLGLLRLIKQFSELDVAFFEAQLVAAERLYPYNLFASIGCTVGHYECSLCGKDIDSEQCPHRRGHLYGGKRAIAIARDILVDHIGVVANPVDKRCVLTLSDGPRDQFPIVRYLSSLLNLGNVTPLTFDHPQFSNIRKANPKWVKLPRNQLCYCRSGKKFKKCCMTKEYIETDHVDIIYRESPALDLIPLG